MYIVDANKFKKILKEKGLRSYQELSSILGIHRNTIGQYLAGRSVFPVKLNDVFEYLEISPKDILVKKEHKKIPSKEMGLLIDKLSAKFRDVTFAMFGSRSRGTHTKYSDLDLGVYCNPPLDHDLYIKIRITAQELAEKLPFSVVVVNLCNADTEFLQNISSDLKFLSGKYTDWINLQRIIYEEKK